ncbi:MAG: ABC-F family ATP-binding cassette domain-containing protein [Nitrospirales bacterium]|nr:ABC-F family ATP-binding cassette domain-containing protein [Nitrospirales bacterium]
MSALIFAQKLTKSFGAKPLFRNVTFGVSEKDRIGIIGPNGSGKSTLLKILAGLERPDEGILTQRQSLRVAYVPQQSDFSPDSTVGTVLQKAAIQAGLSESESQRRMYEISGRTGFSDPGQLVSPLSGGWKKRLAIASGAMQDPDVLLLDEPTNHLDFDGLRWLEQLMVQGSWAWVLISHDRWFLDKTVTQVTELNSRYADGVLTFPGTYSDFLEKRDAFHDVQDQQAQALAGKVRKEEAWLRRGPKARTTKAKYRVETAHALQAQLAEVSNRLRQETTELDFAGSGRKTKRLVVGEGLGKRFGSKVLFESLDIVLAPGITLGLLGVNGSGKSTLLNILAKGLEPDQGSVRHADRLKVVYFDQYREQLNLQLTLRQTLSDTGFTVTYREKSLHVVAWAKRFQFQPEQLDVRMDLLSGGEQARALMARLMLQPADVLIVDEPTNDLDIPTREVLEESLKEFPGALVLVTHDRYMLKEVCTQFLGFNGQGGYAFFAEYEQWEAWLGKREKANASEGSGMGESGGRSHRTVSQKLSYKESQEYTTMEQRILEAEAILAQAREPLLDPSVACDYVKLQAAVETLKAAEQEVERLYARWAELEAKRQSSASV